MVNTILGATRRLLGKPRGLRLSSITTNHIAREAGISVGSLYQYFPNKEAILFALYKDMLSPFPAILASFKTAASLALPREQFFDRFIRAMKGGESEVQLVVQMHHAMKTSPMLAEVDRHHAELIAAEMARFMRHFGSRWSIRKLHRLALHVYYVNYGTWAYRGQVNPPNKEVNEWEIRLLNFMVAQCFE